MTDEILRTAIGTAFGILQTLTLGVLAAALKTYLDVRILKKDMNEAFRKIRDLERGGDYECDRIMVTRETAE